MKILTVEGIPISQIRMKFSGRNGIGRVYDPREKDKKRIKKIISEKFGDHPHFRHPHISFIFYMPIIKSIPKRLFCDYKSGFFRHEKKPDVDNFIKLYLDCMDNICFDGDQRVSLGMSIKLYHPEPKTIIIIEEAKSFVEGFEKNLVQFFDASSKSDESTLNEIHSPHDSLNPLK